MMNFKKYDANLDYGFFAQHDVTVVQHAPWQFGLYHPDIQGKFVWYPARGSLIYEKPDWGIVKLGEFTDTEEVYAEMMKKVWSPPPPLSPISSSMAQLVTLA